MHDLSLVLFSVLSQAAVGLVLLSTLLLYLGGTSEDAALMGALRKAGRLALPLVALAVLASFFHLGDPLGGYRALSNLGSSWMSREILAVVLFGVGTAAYFYLWQTSPGNVGALRLTGLLTGVLGLFTIFATGMIYQLPTRPEWNHWSNLMAGVVTALLLGSLLLALLMLVSPEASPEVLATLGRVALAAVVLLLVSLAFYAPYLVSVPGSTAVLLFANPWFWVRLLVGIGLPVVAAGRMLKGPQPSIVLIGCAFVAALGGELIARSLFYSSVLSQLPLF